MYDIAYYVAYELVYDSICNTQYRASGYAVPSVHRVLGTDMFMPSTWPQTSTSAWRTSCGTAGCSYGSGPAVHLVPCELEASQCQWADNTRPDGGNGSLLYELNRWVWRYGRGQERKDSVLHAMDARAKIIREALTRAGETVKRRRLAARADVPADAAP